MTSSATRRCVLALLLTVVSVGEAAPERLNLAEGRPAEASSTEGKLSAGAATDGKPGSRWVASDGTVPQWWRVDLGHAQDLTGMSIRWENPQSIYHYRVMGSSDGTQWKLLSDMTDNALHDPAHELNFDARSIRYVRIDVVKVIGGRASLREVEVYGWAFEGDAVPQPIDPAKSAPHPDAVEPADQSSLKTVKAPDGVTATIFAAPPAVNYPTCITAAATGEVFVGVDPDGSLGKREGFGKVVRCIDDNDDGIADRVNTFCKVDHPRGLIYDHAGGAGRLWVLHPPHLTLYTDTDNDGVADKEQRLVSDLSTDQNAKRGADHTTNGIRMGIDGWIYIAVGDFGCANATGTDGKKVTLLGGGVMRVRPDGSDLEVYARGLRNIYDVAVDPYMNLFTRDNTNDGGNWNIRFSHIIQSGNYGYPSLFEGYTDEIIPALADHGGGSGCGSMYLHEVGRFPAPFDNAALTCDWGTGKVYAHTPAPLGPTFKENQQVFVSIPRPTDIDVDTAGRLYVTSWQGGGFKYSNDNVGYVARLVASDREPGETPNVGKLPGGLLVAIMLRSPSAATRMAAQREVLTRPAGESHAALVQLAEDKSARLYARVAAIFTLKQLLGKASHTTLLKLVDDPAVREWALRALTDRKSELADVPHEPFISALSDENPRVRVAAAVGLGRLADRDAAPALLAAATPVSITSHKDPAPDAILPHVAIAALVEMNAVDVALADVGGEHHAAALRVLQHLHDSRVVDGLVKRLPSLDPDEKRDVLLTLVRLYFREADYDGGWWWGTRPDRTGPYYKRVTWPGSDTIASALTEHAPSLDAESRQAVAKLMNRQKVQIKGLDLGAATVAGADPQKPDEPTVDLAKIAAAGKDADGVGKMSIEDVLVAIGKAKGDRTLGEQLFTRQGCVACHTTKEGQPLKGPHLGMIGSQYKRDELAMSVLRPNDIIAQGFATVSVTKKDGGAIVGFVSKEAGDEIEVRDIAGGVHTIKTADIAARTELPTSMMPPGLADALSPKEFASLLAYLESLK